jgi:UDP-3-O-[3-hydroxymyristoyl] N-acetylglucosamine deacetylase
MKNQTTLLQLGSKTGIGLHTGELCTVNFRPAKADTGIVFVLNGVEIPAVADHAFAAGLCTGLSRSKQQTKTIEHALSALKGNNIDNAMIEVMGPEIPLLDGSAIEFSRLIKQLGTTTLRKKRKPVKIDTVFKVGNSDAWCSIEPSEDLIFDFEIDFDHPFIGRSCYSFNTNKQRYNVDIAPARTFGFAKDAQALMAQNLALGATLKSVIILTDNGIASGKLRYDDEFVRHKILDAIGDTALIGFPFIGKYTGYKAGHALNIELAKLVRNHYLN